MPIYAVIVEGTGIRIPDVDDPDDVITGFFTTREVEASDEVAAAEVATNMIRREWNTKKYKESNFGSAPDLRIDEIRWLACSFEDDSDLRTRGYTFY